MNKSADPPTGTAKPSLPTKVAIIGTEGTGKTVFATVLAKRYERRRQNEPFFDPNAKTLKYVSKNWEHLSHGRWPERTEAGELVQLRWDVDFPGGHKCEMHLVDCAGQDLRRIFSDEAPPPELKPLIDYVHEAHIILFLVDIGDYVRYEGDEIRIQNTVVLKEAMDGLARQSSKQCAVVFTQADLHRGLLAKHGSWKDVLAEFVPSIAGSHVHRGMPVLAVSAVADVVVDPQEGGFKRVPAPEFRSEGLGEVMRWIEQAAMRVPPPPPTPPPPRHCSNCNVVLAADAPGPLCPACLVTQGKTDRRRVLMAAVVAVVVAVVWWLSQKVPCKSCNAGGTVPGTCRSCSGTGRVTTIGPVPCTMCDETGKRGIWPFQWKCGRCNGGGSVPGRKEVRCNPCGGTGRINTGCIRCFGKGKVARWRSWAVYVHQIPHLIASFGKDKVARWRS